MRLSSPRAWQAAYPKKRAAVGGPAAQGARPFESTQRGHAAVLDLTQQLTRAVEEAVRPHPDHWFWVRRRWQTRPSE